MGDNKSPKAASDLVVGPLLVDMSSFYHQVEQTAAQLPPERLEHFLNEVIDLLADGGTHFVTIGNSSPEVLNRDDVAAAHAGKRCAFRLEVAGLDELCAAALLAAGLELH